MLGADRRVVSSDFYEVADLVGGDCENPDDRECATQRLERALVTDSHDPMRAVREGLQLLSGDLGCICGALREIATVWRRAHQSRPELPLARPAELERATHEVAASAKALAGAGFGQPPELAFSVAGQLTALRTDLRQVEAITCRADLPRLGDAELWANAGAALQQAGNRLLTLIVQLATIEDWSLTEPGAGPPEPDRAWLQVQLG